MAHGLSPAKILLLAVELATHANVDALAWFAAQHESVLRKEILLRILLTYLPETLASDRYVAFIQKVAAGDYTTPDAVDIDTAEVDSLSEEVAARRARKLHLLPLSRGEASGDADENLVTQFLLQRAYKVDEEAGLLDELPALLVPFLDHSSSVRTLMISAILPLLRRNYEYYPEHPIPHTLIAFQTLPDRVAVSLLLSQTGTQPDDDHTKVGRDLRGLVGPWLYNEKRWYTRTERPEPPSVDPSSRDLAVEDDSLCPGWEQVLEWLTGQATKSWRVAVSAVEQWDGPSDVDLGGFGVMWLDDEEQEHLEKTYARAALASAYLIPEASKEGLLGAYSIVSKMRSLLDQDALPPLHVAASVLSPLSAHDVGDLLSARYATYLRNDLLLKSNVLTAPTQQAMQLLHGFILSAFLLTSAGLPCTVRRAGELTLLQDEREQKTLALDLIRAIGSNGPKSDDKYWIRMRNEILWLRDWGSEEDPSFAGKQVKGPFGQLTKEFFEVEILKALLANTRYSLARSLYEDSPDKPLPRKTLQDTVFAAALSAFDNASNPNRTRGGLKRCDDILKTFPQTIERSLVATQRIESLLKAAHTLGNYRLVLKQGEPFTPVVLRVHSDPLSIIAKILEQNPKSYTKIQELIDLGTYMVEAGLTVRDKAGHSTLTAEQEPVERFIAEKRVTAMCIDAALAEDDFETAYSYVTQRLSTGQPGRRPSASPSPAKNDDYSWRAALRAGKYRRTARTLRPTHLGTSSANPEIRHLEQRIECLATALHLAPSATLQDIVNAFRRCEEELDSAIKAEAEQEAAWDAAADSIGTRGPRGAGAPASMPGGFNPPTSKNATASARFEGVASRQHAEEVPMSLFDLSRASVRSAQRNLTALSGLQRSILARGGGGGGGNGDDDGKPATTTTYGSGGEGDSEDGQPRRVRKRDQLREAAVGTLVSSVGWLINAPAPSDRPERE
ncbi:hypothetical protein VTK73DRAFT_4082 [Phialemonium thermophilum]|uniref:Sec39 domain-containing protein n=1 Tax=Phialemonium thermophilum TaxID=223376 RepID=A0ABR3WV53_9PEZI